MQLHRFRDGLGGDGSGGTDTQTTVPDKEQPENEVPSISSSDFYTGTATLLSTTSSLDSIAYMGENGEFWAVQRGGKKNNDGNTSSSFTYGKASKNIESLNHFYDHQSYGMQVSYNAIISKSDNSLTVKLEDDLEKTLYDLKPNSNLILSDLNGLIGYYNGNLSDMLSPIDAHIPEGIIDTSADMTYPANLDIQATNNTNELSFKLTIPSTTCNYTGIIKPYSSQERYFFKLDASLNDCPQTIELYEPIQSISGHIIKDEQGIVLTGYTERGVINVPDATAQGSILFLGE